MRFNAFRRKTDSLKDFWFVFDSVLVALNVSETWLMTTIIALTSSSLSGGIGNASVLRMARLLRLLRMARMARVLRAMPELMILIKGIAVATRSVFFTLLLLSVIIYVFSVTLVQVTKGADESLFSNVPETMLTLLLRCILPDHAGFVAEVLAESWLLAIMLLVFVLMGDLTVMNMLVGVLVEVVMAVSQVEREQLEVGFVKKTLQDLIVAENLDENGDNCVSKREFECLLEKPEAARALSTIGVDVVGLVDFTEFIFQEDRNLSFPEFMEILLQLRGTNTATVKDIVDLRKFILQETNLVAKPPVLFRSGTVDGSRPGTVG